VKRLAILGASGHGKVVAEVAELTGWDVAFFDDGFPVRSMNGGWRVEGNTEHLLERTDQFTGVAIAIGQNTVRIAKLLVMREAGFSLPVLIHPRAVVSERASLGDGTVVFAGAVINPFVEAGEGCIFNTLCSVDHDCRLGDGVHVSPGANIAGGVSVGRAAWIGIGSCVRQLVHIGEQAVVGAGAAVVNDVPDGVTVLGVPARSR